MLKKYFPDAYVESVTSIDFQKIYDLGFRLVVFDIDNTLAHHGESPSSEVEQLFRSIHAIGLKTMLYSDNGEERISRFKQNINTLSVAEAQKPNAAKLTETLDQLGLPKNKIIYIGDQVFKDIVMANQAGIKSVLVKYMRKNGQKTGIRRRLEQIILWFYRRWPKSANRLGDILIDSNSSSNQKKLFCQIHPLFYKISVKKEQLKYSLRDFLRREKIAKKISHQILKAVISKHSSQIIKRSKGIDPQTQINKKNNIELACRKINGIIVYPGQTFSFWKTVGDSSKAKGFKEGRVIQNNQLITGVGGGLCNLANTINYIVLKSPLVITEFHKHSDALAPDVGKRKPLSSGTSVSYNYVDYRFKNTTDRPVQLLTWVDGDLLRAELRSTKSFPWNYQIIEEDHHFIKEKGKFYRKSKIYIVRTEKKTGEVLEKRLVLDNRSEVMFDYGLIPKNSIRN